MDKQLLLTTNGDGQPLIPMSEEQKYLFDLKGWIALPGVLDQEQLGPVRQHQMKFLYQRDSLPPEQRDNHGGLSQILLDHPVVAGVLNEIISHQALASEDCYGFRFDHTYTSHRKRATTTLIHTAVVDFSTSVATPIFTRCRKGKSMPG